MHRIVHFEIQAENPTRAIAFYERVLGWKFKKWSGPQDYWLISTGQGPGIDGGLHVRQGPTPADGQSTNCFTCTVDTESVDSTTARVVEHGGTCVVPKFAIPGVGWLAYYKDTEGNIWGAMQDDPKAGS